MYDMYDMNDAELELEGELQELMSALLESDLESEAQSGIPDKIVHPKLSRDLATPVIYLSSVTISGCTTPFSKATSGFESFVCDSFPYPQCFLSINGRILVEEKGARRSFTAADRAVWQPVSVLNHAYPGQGVSVSHNPEARVGADGNFTAESQLVVDPGTRRIRLLISLDFRLGKQITTEGIIQHNPLECFLAFMDDWEMRREPWRTSPPCRDAVTRLEFLSATRKMFQPTTNKDGTPPSPGWKAMFDTFLARNKEICPLAEFNSPQARALWRFERLEVADSMVNIGHVLTGIEGGRRQKPGSTYPYVFSVRDGNTEATLTWAGDLGKALELYGEAKVTGQQADLGSYLGKAAGPDNLVGDIDGINLAAIYDENKSVADNFRSYYHAKPFRRFHDFLTFAKDDSGILLFALASNSQTTLGELSRRHAGGRIAFFASVLKIYKIRKGLLNLTPSQESELSIILTDPSKETNAVVDYFFSFLEKGLRKER